MKNFKRLFLFCCLALAIPLGYAVWPGTNVNTTNLDSGTDNPAAARVDLLDLTQKFNQVRGHVSTFMQGVLDDADAAAARTTLGAAASSGGTISGATLSGTTTNSGTISGGTISGATLSGTTTNSGTISGGTLSGNTISNAVSINVDGAVTSDKACAAGYTRVGPNYCSRDAALTYTDITRDTCTAITLPAADAQAIVVTVLARARAANAVGFRQTIVRGYADGACTALRLEVINGVQEFDAMPAATLIGETVGMMILASTTPALFLLDDTGNQGVGRYFITGYFD